MYSEWIRGCLRYDFRLGFVLVPRWPLGFTVVYRVVESSLLEKRMWFRNGHGPKRNFETEIVMVLIFVSSMEICILFFCTYSPSRAREEHCGFDDDGDYFTIISQNSMMTSTTACV